MGNLSVIVPTYNRKDVLLKVLEAYAGQTAPQDICELLVVDDGSTDGTSETVREWAEKSSPPFPVRYLRQQNKGLAAARNHGIREARGSVALFADDDIIPSPDLAACHAAWHRKCPEPFMAAVGQLVWARELHPTPFMEWLGIDGIRFQSGKKSFNHALPFTSIIFGHTSVKLDFLRKHGIFDEAFRTYGCEDSELAYRLVKKGLRAFYLPEAIGYHYKSVSFQEACRHREKMAEARKVYLTREAGIEQARIEREWFGTRKNRIRALVARCLIVFLLPLKPLLDSHIRLPAAVYKLFYFYYGRYKPARYEKQIGRMSRSTV